MPAPDGLVIAVPDALVDELVERVATRSLVIQVATSATTADRSRVTTAAAGAGVAVTVVNSTEADFRGELESADCAFPYCDTLSGGVRIVGSDGDHAGACTAGFWVKSRADQKPYLMTAGHCLNGFNNDSSFWQTVLPGVGSSYQLIGYNHNPYKWGADGDAGLIGINSESILRLGFGRLTQPWVWVKRPTGMVRYAIKGVETTPKGQVVCTSGAVSGYHCGPVTEVNKTVSLGKSILPWAGTKVQHESAVDVCRRSNNPIMPGDSGAPVFKSHKARGTLSGGSHSGCTMFYQGAVEAQNLLNVNIVTSGG